MYCQQIVGMVIYNETSFWSDPRKKFVAYLDRNGEAIDTRMTGMIFSISVMSAFHLLFLYEQRYGFVGNLKKLSRIRMRFALGSIRFVVIIIRFRIYSFCRENVFLFYHIFNGTIKFK